MAVATTKKPTKISHRKLTEDIAFQPITRKDMTVNVSDGVGVVNDVMLLGWKSRNKGRQYLPEGVKPEMYEGKEVFVDHPDPADQKKPRSINDKFGWVEGTYKTDRGLFAKAFKFNPKHPIAESFKFWAKQNPRQIGFSQNAFGDVYEAADGELVEEVTEVRSIDLVADPATTKGLFESYLQEETEVEQEETEKGEGHTGWDGGPGKKGSGNTTSEDTSKDSAKKAKSAPTSSVTPVEKLVTEDEEEEDETYKKDEKGEKPEHLEEDEMQEEDTDDIMNDGEAEPGGDEEEPVATEEPPGETGEIEEPGEGEEEVAVGGDPDMDISAEVESACGKIIADTSIPLPVKIKRIAHLLKIHPAHVEESVKITDFPMAKRVAARTAKKYKIKSVAKLLEWIDTREVTDALNSKKKKMFSLLKAAKLPDEVVTLGFKEQLLECKNERSMQNMIDDRRKLVDVLNGKNKPKVKPRSTVGAGSGGAREPELLQEDYRREPKKLSKNEQELRLQEFEEAAFAGVGWGE